MKVMLLGFILSLALIACEREAGASDPSRSLSIVTANHERHEFSVELALTPAQQEHGLMNRTEMAADAGMLFFFGTEAPRSFWMKNTLIPLDMIFIARDGTIINIHENAKPNDLTSVKSGSPASAVLEINGGLSKKLGLAAGDKAHHILFGNALK